MSMKNSNDTIGIRNCDLPVCSAVPQLAAPPRAPKMMYRTAVFYLKEVKHSSLDCRAIERCLRKLMCFDFYNPTERIAKIQSFCVVVKKGSVILSL